MDVGVRELRGNLSRSLQQVRAGEELTVTDHGRAIARSVPTDERPIDRLVLRADHVGLHLDAAAPNAESVRPKPSQI